MRQHMNWPLSEEEEALFRFEIGERAWSWAQDCNPYEANTFEEVRWMLPGGFIADMLSTSQAGPFKDADRRRHE